MIKNRDKLGRIIGSKKIDIVCPICSKSFKAYISENKKYCSRACFKINYKEWRNKWLGSGAKGKHWVHNQEYKNKFSKMRMGNKNPMYVKHLSMGNRLSISEKLKGKMPIANNRENKWGKYKRGWYDINGISMFFRSKWEVNYALYLDWLIKEKQILKWEYEADVFMFDKIKLGTRSYRPDFKIYNNNGKIEYHEIKGWMDKKSATKIKRMRIYYPEVKLIVVESAGYKDLVKKVGRICGFIN
jgi:endogenous inhibitor of DNA gyrase (YacG/DUF329 family)